MKIEKEEKQIALCETIFYNFSRLLQMPCKKSNRTAIRQGRTCFCVFFALHFLYTTLITIALCADTRHKSTRSEIESMKKMSRKENVICHWGRKGS